MKRQNMEIELILLQLNDKKYKLSFENMSDTLHIRENSSAYIQERASYLFDT